MCHNFGESQVLIYDENLKLIGDITGMGIKCHSLFELLDGELWCCNSDAGEVTSLDRTKSFYVGGFTRGIALTEEHIIVGSSRNYHHEITKNPNNIPCAKLSFVNRKTFEIENILELKELPVIMEILLVKDLYEVEAAN
jgi:hypothetical protein